MRILSFAVSVAALVAAPALAADITGSVVDEAGKPVVNAMVYCFSEERLETPTSAEGSFRITLTAAAPEKLFLTIVAPGKAPLFLGEVSTNGTPIKATLKQGVTKSGKVVDPAGKPVSGVRVKVVAFRNPADPKTPRMIPVGLPGWQEARTDAEGNWTVGELPAGYDAVVALTEPKYLATTAQGAKPIVAQPAAIIRGRILGTDGKPCASMKVSLTGEPYSSEATTDTEGRFSMGQLPDKEYTLSVQGSAAGGVLEARSVTATPGEEKNLGELTLMPGVLVRGQVVEKGTSKGTAGVRVSLAGRQSVAAPASNEYTTTDKEGFWTLRTLPGDVKLYLEGGYPRKWEAPSGPALLTVPDTTEFQAPTQSLTRIPVVRLKVTDEKGQPLAGIPLHVSIGTYSIENDPWSSVTDKEGRWSSESDPYSYIRAERELRISTPEKWEIVSSETIPLPLPQSEINVVVRPNQNAALVGRVVDIGGKPVPDMPLNAYIYPREKSRYEGRSLSLRSDANGEYRIPGRIKPEEEIMLLPFAVELRVISTGERKKGAAQFTDTVVERFTSKARGRVIDSSGKPVAGALVWNAVGRTSTRTGADGAFLLEKLPQRGGVIAAGKSGLSGRVRAEPGASKLVITLAAPPKQTPEQAREQAQRLVAQVQALGAPGQGVRKGTWDRDLLASTIGLADPALALNVGRNAQGVLAEAVTGGVINALCDTEPELADRLLRQNIQSFGSAYERFYRAAEVCSALWETQPTLARFWLTRALKESEGIGADALWQTLGVPAFVLAGAERDAFVSELERGEKKTEATAMRIAMQPATADALLAELPEKERTLALAHAVGLLSKTSGLGLATLAERLTQQSSESEYETGAALAQAIRKLGPTSPALALKLAERAKGYYASFALALAARVQPDSARKEALLREQVRANGSDNRLAVLIALEEVPALREEVRDEWEVAAIALARIDPVRARQAAEFAVYRTLENARINEPDTARGMRQSALLALAAISPAAALQLVEGLEDDEARAAGKAWVAAMLLLSPEKRLAVARKRIVYMP